MSNEISAINSASASEVSSSSGNNSSTKPLSNETKKKLEALGIDTSNITSESDGKAALVTAQASAAAAKTSHSNSTSSQSGAVLKATVENFASKLGVSVAPNDDMATILNNLKTKITEMKASAGTDSTKLANANGNEATLATISDQYSQMKSAQAKLTGTLDSLASYNKAALGLS